MLPWTKLIHIGDISLMLAAAAAMTAWLVAACAWRMAFWWSFLFTLGIGLVGATKVAFMAWGTSLPGLDYRAVSGHAAGVTAVLPTLFYLLLWQRGARARRFAVAAGLALGALMGVLLVATGDHSIAEAIAGWAIGAMISLGGIGLAGELPPRRPVLGLMFSALVFMSAVFLIRPVPFGYLMFRTAAFMAGKSTPFPGAQAVEQRHSPTREESSCVPIKYRDWYSKNKSS